MGEGRGGMRTEDVDVCPYPEDRELAMTILGRGSRPSEQSEQQARLHQLVAEDRRTE